jgi:RimJ/RimL family protein N-acetyltransferase
MTVEATHLDTPARSPLADWLAGKSARMSGRLKLGLHTALTRYGLNRDLAVPIANPAAKIPILVRRLEPRDVAALLSYDAAAASAQEKGQEKAEVAVRRNFLAKGAQNGFVAIDQRNGAPCYVQWLFGARDNAFVSQLKGFPVLAPHQALLENAYTPPAYRGFGIMSAAMALIAERGAEIGARHVLTFVGLDNIASLKGCQRAGFNPLILHRSVRFGFGTIRRDRFEQLAEGDPRRTARF